MMVQNNTRKLQIKKLGTNLRQHNTCVIQQQYKMGVLLKLRISDSMFVLKFLNSVSSD